MTLSSYFIYLSISIAASASPGPSVLLAASNGINYGREKALWGVAGHVSAILLLAIISATGLGAILLASPTAFTLLKYIGAAYLLYTGIKIWRSKSAVFLPGPRQAQASAFKLYRQSFMLALTNPKALMFFSALFPQFIQPEKALWPQFMLLAATSLFNAFFFTAAYVFFADKCKNRLAGSNSSIWFSRFTGSLFVGFAGVMALGR
ncbi:LysE family translocator [Thalassomonas viridans]|uniref:LysE family translocator n=1 Tax=Thalassomonas viridans TaxID=137584 RepID=A0AAE9Z525_9GAMM|nr:LysE family translocator [Thalassomonas viridans]WDE06753.1 LysE family translocator [Thalassomonas viridans]